VADVSDSALVAAARVADAAQDAAADEEDKLEIPNSESQPGEAGTKAKRIYTE